MPRTIDVSLTVGEATAVVNVTDTAPLLTPETVTTARQITGEEITRVPTSTRSFTQLTTAAAGVSADIAPVAVNSNGNVSPSVNGTRTTATSLYFNGIDATNITSNEGSLTDNIAPAPETLQEVKLQTSLYDASTGVRAAAIFNSSLVPAAIVYRKRLLLRSKQTFRLKRILPRKRRLGKPAATRNEAGFTLGGPIIKTNSFSSAVINLPMLEPLCLDRPQHNRLPLALTLINGERTAATSRRLLTPCARV